MNIAKRLVNNCLGYLGYRISRIERGRTSVATGDVGDIGRDYTDESAALPRVCCRKGTPHWYAGHPTEFIVDNGSSTIEQEILYSHLTLLKLIKHFDFESILDIGSHAGNCTNVFRHLGKKVTTCEISPGYEADYKVDYLQINFLEKFDAIWCSQVFEHQRNPGIFLNKIFDDLQDDGVLALTVPGHISRNLEFGHCNIFTPLHLIYHLVMAGFDCRDISLKCYLGNIGIILHKKYNGINQRLPQGTLPLTQSTSGEAVINGKKWDVRQLLGDEIFGGMASCFPPDVQIDHTTAWDGNSINWPNPI